MGIINRDLGRSQKQTDEAFPLGVIANGVTQLLKIVPYNALLTGANVAAFGVSASPVWSLSYFRFNATGGLTSIGAGATLAVGGIGTSGCLGFSLAAPGITLLAGDVLCLTAAGAAAVATSVITLVMMPTADIKVYQNSVA